LQSKHEPARRFQSVLAIVNSVVDLNARRCSVLLGYSVPHCEASGVRLYCPQSGLSPGVRFDALEMHAELCLELGGCCVPTLQHQVAAESSAPRRLDLDRCRLFPSHPQSGKHSPTEALHLQSGGSLSICAIFGQPYAHHDLNAPCRIDFFAPSLLSQVHAHERLHTHRRDQDTQKPPSVHVSPENRLNVQAREGLGIEFAELLPTLVRLHQETPPCPLEFGSCCILSWKLCNAISSYTLLNVNCGFSFRTIFFPIEVHAIESLNPR
jgi:hypothetical protein